MKRSYLKRKPYELKRSKLNPIKGLFKLAKGNKYNASRYVCRQEHRHDSIGEGQHCDNLALLKKAGEIKDYRIQILYDLVVNGKKVTGHRVDFEVENNDGSIEIQEFKGFATALWALKRKLFIALYPNIPYKTVYK